ncbi:MAG TPA: hypothetical protein VFL41_07550 [Gaiellaceae bacterium]|nr:hypothetical protein [Gaiellaceae bacterium]
MAADALRPFAVWFYAASAYNLLWGSAVVVDPAPIAALAGSDDSLFLRVVGLFVLVFAPAYWWAARRPDAHAHLVLVAVLGKLGGAVGFAGAAAAGTLPLAFAPVIVLNDAVWLPAFGLYLRRAARLRGGWRPLLAG